MPFIEADDGCEIYYEAYGSGPALVFVSGFMGITDIWREQFEVFANEYRCIAFDTRGAGRSDKPLPAIAYGVTRHAQDLACLLEQLDIRRCVLVGHSMGGNIACTYADGHRDLVAGIVFVGSYVAGTQIISVGNTLERIKHAVAKKSDRLNFYRGVGLPYDIALEATKWPLYAIVGNAESFIAFDGKAILQSIEVPCLVIHGDSDVVSPYEPCAMGLRECLRDARVVLLENVNHCPMLEAAPACNKAITAYLNQGLKF